MSNPIGASEFGHSSSSGGVSYSSTPAENMRPRVDYTNRFGTASVDQTAATQPGKFSLKGNKKNVEMNTYGQGSAATSGNQRLQDDNERLLDGLQNGVKKLLVGVTGIGAEIREGNDILGGFSGDFDGALDGLKGTLKGLANVVKSGGGNHMYYMIFFVMFIFLLLWFFMR